MSLTLQSQTKNTVKLIILFKSADGEEIEKMESPHTKKCKILFAPDDRRQMQYWQIRESLSNNKPDKLRTERAGVQCCKDLAVCLSSVYKKHNGSVQPFQGLSRGFMQCLHYINLLDVPLSFYSDLLKPEKNKT